VAKKKAAGPTVDELALQALRRGLERGDAARLVKTGTKPEGAALFDGDKTAVQKEAIQLCLDRKLLEVVRTETVKSGRTVKEHRFVTVTPSGVGYLADRLAPDEADALLRARLGQLDGEVRELELQLTQAVGVQRQGLEAIESLFEAYARRLAAAADGITSKLKELRSRADAITVKLQPHLRPSEDQVNTTPKRETTGLDDPGVAESRRRLARETVVAWENITDPAAREWVESALFNAGVEPIGTVGEYTEFVGRLHECTEPGAFSGKPVQVIEPGWLLHDDQGEFLLTKAKVRLVPPQPTE
jgi:hypothetical protein